MARAWPDESLGVGDLHLSFPAVPQSVSAVRAALGSCARDCGFSQAAVQAVQLAGSEAASNVVLHAYRPPREPATIDVTAAYRDHALTITVSDAGTGLRPDPDSPGLGFGLLVISKLADAVKFARSPAGGMSVQMRFNA